ncbi:hypothetical protein D3C73_806500 [compost metagenome]
MMIGWLILVCEIMFWVFVAGGLLARYFFHANKVSIILLICTPITDLVLLIATVLDLSNGATAHFMHGLAAYYIGMSIAFGHRIIAACDERFAQWFADGPQPRKRYGKEHASHERAGWFRHLLAWFIGNGILLFMIRFVDDAVRTEQLENVMQVWIVLIVVDFLYSFSYTLWPRENKSIEK